MDTNKMTEFEELAKIIDDEIEARVVNDEVDAHIINDEVDAHLVNDEIDAYTIEENLSQVAATFDALEADGVNVPAMSPEDYDRQSQLQAFQNKLDKYNAAMVNHQPGQEHRLSDGVVYTVQNVPHRGMWIREKRKSIGQNLKNNSVRRKITKNPDKYNIGSFTL